MKITYGYFLALFILLAPTMVLAENGEQKKNSCVECHKLIDDENGGVVGLMAHDVHAQVGLSCADCHGGDPSSDDIEVAKSPQKGFIGAPKRNEIPQFCARCHADPNYMRPFNPNLPTDQFSKYQTSEHGKRNAQGDDHVAVCSSCHGAHGIRRVNDPLSPIFKRNAPLTCSKCHSDPEYMKAYGIPTDQFEKYKKGVHGILLLEKGNLGAPACHSCHGSHEASRPVETSVGNVCAQCHTLNRDLFAASPHKKAHDQMKVPECAVCHENHFIQKTSDDMLGTGPGAICLKCHKQDSNGYHSAKAMRGFIEDLKGQVSQAETAVVQAEHIGMDMSDSRVELDQAVTLLTKARSYVHSFSPPKIESITKEGKTVADHVKQAAKTARAQWVTRRKGLWVAILFLILLAAGLFLDIRRREKKS
ncbi:MAG: cytochrome c3 family protein [Chlamydiae bacterium]|nr:cytochrome c3 family protein [Chlamydiota bacterium]MBI3265627.1 cytochrome c3 family protein [Chlamydiota bacterium]